MRIFDLARHLQGEGEAHRSGGSGSQAKEASMKRIARKTSIGLMLHCSVSGDVVCPGSYGKELMKFATGQKVKMSV